MHPTSLSLSGALPASRASGFPPGHSTALDAGLSTGREAYSLARHLPEHWSVMRDVTQLRLWNCDSAEIPQFVWHLDRLETLELCHGRRLEAVPASIGRFKRLRVLSFAGCTSLRTISDEIGRLDSLQELDLSYCRHLQRVPYGVQYLRRLLRLDLSGCLRLRLAPDPSALPAGCELRLPCHLVVPIVGGGDAPEFVSPKGLSHPICQTRKGLAS